MSHFVTLRTEISERENLLAALKDLGYSFSEGEKIRLISDNRADESAEIVVETGCDYQIGFRQCGNHYEMVADWYNIERMTSLRRQTFLQQLTQRYAYNIVCDQAREQNLIIEEERQEGGDIVLVISERG